MKRNRVGKVLIISLIAVFFLDCENADYDNKLTVETVDISEEFEAISPKHQSKPEKTKVKFNNLKIIRSASVRYKVRNVKNATEMIKGISKNFNAYISELRFENNLYKKENRFTLKVPSNKFDFIMDSISSVAEFIEFENITTKDVTSEFIDIEARLKTKLEVKERYEFILRNRAKSVEDLLDVEHKLQLIQEEIESSQGRLKYLTNKVGLSTIQVDLYETVEFKEEPTAYKKTFGSEFKEAFISGWDFVKSIFIALIYVWPILLIGIMLFVILKKRINKVK